MVLAFVAMTALSIILYAQLDKAKFLSRSQSSRYGRLTEQFLPIVASYPWDSHNFRFIGSPVDGIQFEDDRIIVVEFKAGKGSLSKKQRKIRDLVKAGKVEFEVVKIEG